jgi:hypothetical protein
MNASPYNHFFEIPGGRTIIVYNAFSGQVAEIEMEHYASELPALLHGSLASSSRRAYDRCVSPDY